MRQRIIRTKYHGIADYITGLFLIASPLLGFSDQNIPVWIAALTAVAILSISLCTKYEVGFIPLIPMELHLQLDLFIGLFLVLSPWLFSFSGIPAWVFIVIGIMEICAGIFTHKMPYLTHEKIT